jgi:hypothetical protein
MTLIRGLLLASIFLTGCLAPVSMRESVSSSSASSCGSTEQPCGLPQYTVIRRFQDANGEWLTIRNKKLLKSIDPEGGYLWVQLKDGIWKGIDEVTYKISSDGLLRLSGTDLRDKKAWTSIGGTTWELPDGTTIGISALGGMWETNDTWIGFPDTDKNHPWNKIVKKAKPNNVAGRALER